MSFFSKMALKMPTWQPCAFLQLQFEVCNTVKVSSTNLRWSPLEVANKTGTLKKRKRNVVYNCFFKSNHFNVLPVIGDVLESPVLLRPWLVRAGGGAVDDVLTEAAQQVLGLLAQVLDLESFF